MLLDTVGCFWVGTFVCFWETLGTIGCFWVLLGSFGFFWYFWVLWVLAETGKLKLTIASIDHNLVLFQLNWQQYVSFRKIKILLIHVFEIEIETHCSLWDCQEIKCNFALWSPQWQQAASTLTGVPHLENGKCVQEFEVHLFSYFWPCDTMLMSYTEKYFGPDHVN